MHFRITSGFGIIHLGLSASEKVRDNTLHNPKHKSRPDTLGFTV